MNNWTYAGFWWRVLAYFIDGVILYIPQFLISLGFSKAVQLPQLTLLSTKFHSLANPALLISFFTFFILIIIRWLYAAGLQSSAWHATVGQKICNLVITDTQGQGISFARASGRYFAMFISTFTCCIGYFMAAFTERNQTLHDMIAGTVVLRNTDNGIND